MLTVQNRFFCYYRSQRSCGQGYVFTRVCDSVNGGVSSRENPPQQGDPPSGRETPGRETPPGKETPPSGKETPRQGDPPGKETPLWQGDPPGIRSMSGRYASYWNAFLFIQYVCLFISVKFVAFVSETKTVIAI